MWRIASHPIVVNLLSHIAIEIYFDQFDVGIKEK